MCCNIELEIPFQSTVKRPVTPYLMSNGFEKMVLLLTDEYVLRSINLQKILPKFFLKFYKILEKCFQHFLEVSSIIVVSARQ